MRRIVMYRTIIKSRSFFIEDDEMRKLVGNSNISYNVVKDKSGDVVVVAIRDAKGMKVYSGRRMRTTTPSVLKSRAGKEVDVYVERLRPLPNEVFRVRPVDFKFDELKNRTVATTPYLTDYGIVIPQMYINKITKSLFRNNLTVSFNNTTASTLRDGYLIAHITSSLGHKAHVDEYKLRECGSGIRTSKMVPTLNFLDRNGKELSNYEFKGTLEARGKEFGVMFFREKV
jgi:hypothetical protein